MQFSTILVSALAAFATAAPTSPATEAPVELSKLSELPGLQTRANFNFDLASVNQFQFLNQDLAYLNVLNQLQFQNLFGLSINNGLNLGAFESLFRQQQLDLNSLILLSQLHAVNQIASLGVFSTFNMQTFNFVPFELGLLGGFNQVNFGQFITPTIGSQVGNIAQQQRGISL